MNKNVKEAMEMIDMEMHNTFGWNLIKQELDKLDKIREVVKRNENAEKMAKFNKLMEIKQILGDEVI